MEITDIGTRQEHLEWCKKRALEYCDQGDIRNAVASMGSDMQKHSETQNHPALKLMVVMLLSGHLSTKQELRRFIEGFN